MGVNPMMMNQVNHVGLGGVANQPAGQNQLMMQPMMPMGMQQLPIVGVDDMMGGWNPMMGGMSNAGIAGMAAMAAGGMGPGMLGNVGNMGPMGNMGMLNGFHVQGNGFGPGMFNGNIPGVGLGWGDQFAMEEGWENEAGMMALGINPMAGGMGMPGMGMGPGAMGMGQWGPNMPFEGFQ
jgi:hypothetical protein